MLYWEQLHPCSVCGPATIFLASKISYLLFSNLIHKTETGTWKGGRLLIETRLDQSNHVANQQQVLSFAVSFASLSILCKNAASKPFCWAKLAYFDFSSSKVYCTVHWWSQWINGFEVKTLIPIFLNLHFSIWGWCLVGLAHHLIWIHCCIFHWWLKSISWQFLKDISCHIWL